MFGLTLEKWAYLATTISAITAVVFVIFGVYQLIKLRRQVILTVDSVKAAKRAADAAQEAARETARVRIDEQAPRVLAVMESVQWPPRVSRGLTQMPHANEPRMLDTRTLHGAAEAGTDDYIFPEQEQWLMWFITRGVLINEGRSTARVRLDGEAWFIEGESTLVPDERFRARQPLGRFTALATLPANIYCGQARKLYSSGQSVISSRSGPLSTSRGSRPNAPSW